MAFAGMSRFTGRCLLGWLCNNERESGVAIRGNNVEPVNINVGRMPTFWLVKENTFNNPSRPQYNRLV